MRPILRGPRLSMRCVLFGLAFLSAAPIPLLAQDTAPKVIVFGDSFSDPGNGFAFIKTNATPPDYGLDALGIPSAPYARGGHHLSNGATWIEQLAPLLGAQANVLPAFASANPQAMNFAIATARARCDSLSITLCFEVGSFLQKTGGNPLPSDALYVIELGSNDVGDAVIALSSGDPAAALSILQSAADAIRETIALLHQMGAEHFLVWNVPDAGLTPAARISGAAAFASGATTTFNGLLAAALASLSPLGIGIIPFDADALVKDIVGPPPPPQYGLSNVVDACVTPGVPPFVCRNPDEYLFWDGIHPTKAAHALVALAVAKKLGVI